jgi:hypothetical protein
MLRLKRNGVCGITGSYCKGNGPCSECIIRIYREDIKMAKVNIEAQTVIGAPKFIPGQVIDLSYKHGGLPNRIKIAQVMLSSVEAGYTYNVALESTKEITNMNEQFILDRACHKGAPVYSLDTIRKRYERGWRFCGNYYDGVAVDKAKDIAKSHQVAHVRITEAYYPDGNFVYGQCAVWLQYKNPIADEGDSVDINSGKFFTKDIK